MSKGKNAFSASALDSLKSTLFGQHGHQCARVCAYNSRLGNSWVLLLVHLGWLKAASGDKQTTQYGLKAFELCLKARKLFSLRWQRLHFSLYNNSSNSMHCRRGYCCKSPAVIRSRLMNTKFGIVFEIFSEFYGYQISFRSNQLWYRVTDLQPSARDCCHLYYHDVYQSTNREMA